MRRPFERLSPTSATIRVDPSASVAPLRDALLRLFDDQQVSVTTDSEQTDEVVVVRDGQVVATSSAAAIMESLLLVNSDVYITGSRGLDNAALPPTVQALHDLPFRLAGYPESDSEKLLLIALSRAIERRALDAGRGTLRVGFQRLSRLVDEPGTRRVYERLATTELAVYAYGVGDTALPESLGFNVHTGTTELHRRGWFVVFQPPAAIDVEPAALYAIEMNDNYWDGFWTYTPERINEIAEVITDIGMSPSEPR